MVKIVYGPLRQQHVDEATTARNELADFRGKMTELGINVPPTVDDAIDARIRFYNSQLKAWRDEATGKYRNDPNWANMDAGRNAPLNHNGAFYR